jgi:hypothetical protein
VACLAMEASSRSSDQDFRLDAVVEAEALHNQHGVLQRHMLCGVGGASLWREWVVAPARRGGCAYGTGA